MKSLIIYNTLTRKKEQFVPFFDEGKKKFVGIYSCGPTVYDEPHFGNLRAMMTADMIRNIIKNIMGYPTISVSNFTDVGHMVGDGDGGEDKMEKGSKKTGKTAWELAKYYENIFIEYFSGLNIESFDHMPRATEYIQQQLEIVQILEKKGFTYEIPGDGIYFDTSKVSDYGKLLGPNYKKHLEGLNAGERVDMSGKKNPTDFALWKFSPKDQKRQMEWDSPWGKSFPGWHTECCAMSKAFLGNQFDIHHGGYDLIPVHHTNEIVQAENAFEVSPWVKYWMHTQFVTMKGEKMSKSKGNYVSPKEILEKGYSFLDLRYFFLLSHYRAFIDFNYEKLDNTKISLNAFFKKLFNLIKTANDLGIISFDNVFSIDFHDISGYEKFQAKYLINNESVESFENIIDEVLNDFNLAGLFGEVNKLFSQISNEKILKEIIYIILWLDEKLLKLDMIKNIKKIYENTSQKSESIPEEIKRLAEKRWKARSQKEWILADQIRDDLLRQGYEIKDSKDGYEILKK